MTKNKVSVIIPVYNGVAWIRECIDSVLASTFQNFEIIVLDDHSADGTTEAVERLAKEDERIRLILRDSKGVSGARNVMENILPFWMRMISWISICLKPLWHICRRKAAIWYPAVITGGTAV